MPIDLALREPGGAVAGVVYRLHQLLHRHAAAIEQHRRLPAGEIDLDFINPGVGRERLLNRGLALMAMHSFDLDDGKLIPADIGRHWWNSHGRSSGAKTKLL